MYRERKVRIADPTAFAAVIRQAIESGFEGNQSAARRSVGISQPQLSRYLDGKMQWVRFDTVRKLYELIGHASDAYTERARQTTRKRSRLKS
jgi:hypothetical protein